MKKVTKLSLVALMALGTAAYAEEVKKDAGLKVSGKVTAWYQTMAHGGVSADKGLFIYDDVYGNDWANVGAMLRVSGAASDHVDIGVALQGVTTMGTENFLASAETASGAYPSTTGLQSLSGSAGFPFWLHELHFTYKVGNTHVKFGRQELDTPLVFTEAWNSTANSFEAAVLTNTDLPATTIEALWIAKGNGAGDTLHSAPQVFGTEAGYSTFMAYNLDGDATGYSPLDSNDSKGGMFAVGVKNKTLSFMPITAYYYSAPDAVQAYWTQGDLSLKDMIGMDVSAQGIIAGIAPQGKVDTYLKADNGGDKAGTATGFTHAVAGKVAANIAGVALRVALSKTTAGNIPVANMGTNYKKTKLPTASIFNDGMVAAQPNTFAMLIGAGYKVAGINIGASYGSYTIGTNSGFDQINTNVGGPASMGYIVQQKIGAATTMSEIDVSVSTKIQEFSIAAHYINLSNTYVPGGTAASYGTFGNNVVRIVVSESF
ncbi:MAG: hypothetical protein KU37_07460 [Sulfuricurvum sp. PC08-66]|nr:MAG: hypothetical protein KU37_07460 [Sulfuricurvum sp. PC08-66]